MRQRFTKSSNEQSWQSFVHWTFNQSQKNMSYDVTSCCICGTHFIPCRLGEFLTKMDGGCYSCARKNNPKAFKIYIYKFGSVIGTRNWLCMAYILRSQTLIYLILVNEYCTHSISANKLLPTQNDSSIVLRIQFLKFKASQDIARLVRQGWIDSRAVWLSLQE